MLVDDDDAPVAPPPGVAGAPGARRALAGVAAALVLALGAAGAWLSSRSAADPSSAYRAQPLPLSTTTLNAASLVLRKPPPPPDLPVVDVNSLPAAPRRAPARASR